MRGTIALLAATALVAAARARRRRAPRRRPFRTTRGARSPRRPRRPHRPRRGAHGPRPLDRLPLPQPRRARGGSRARRRDRSSDGGRRVRPCSRHELLHLRLLAHPGRRYARSHGPRQPRADPAAGARAPAAGQGRPRPADGQADTSRASASWRPRPRCRARRSPKRWRRATSSRSTSRLPTGRCSATTSQAARARSRTPEPSARRRRRILRGALHRLRPRKQAIVKRHYGIDGTPETLVEIASDLHLSPERTRALKDEALRELAADLTAARRRLSGHGSVVPPPVRAANRRTASTGAAEDRGDKEVRDGSNREPDTPQAGRRIFTRILVGVDGSQQALEAARQAALLQDVDGQLTLLAVWDIAPVMGGTGTRIPYYLDEDFSARPRRRGCARRPNTSRPTPPPPPSWCAARPWPRCSRRSSVTKTRCLDRQQRHRPAARDRRRRRRDRD